MRALVSILIPARNAERWIAETIGSALAQTWRDKEIIVVDDGSEDRTLAVAGRLEAANVKVIAQAHRGASVARNRALAAAGGDYIQWLDADDLLASGKIASQLNACGDSVEPLVLFSSRFGVFYWRHQKARFAPTAIWRDLEPIDYLVRSFSNDLCMNPAVWLVSRKLTDKAGPWDERLSRNDDGEYFCRVVAASERVKFVADARSYYRQSGFSQLSRSVSRRSLQSLALSLALNIEHLLAVEDSDRTRNAAFLLVDHCVPWFQPANLDLIEAWSTKLGREITAPQLDSKAAILQRVVGNRIGTKLLTAARKTRFAAAVQWDRLMYRLGPIPQL